MPILRSLVPYLAVAVLVVAGSLGALAVSLSSSGLLTDSDAAAASPTPAVARATVRLSSDGRLAYWRREASGARTLFVSNIDGTQRQAIATADQQASVHEMRWLPAGDAVAYIDGRTRAVVVQRLDGRRTEVRLPNGVVAPINDHQWSPSGAFVALSVGTSGGGRVTSDVYIARLADGVARQATTLEDAYAAEWLSEDELLVETMGGMIAVLTRDGALRPIAGPDATSPVVGTDGRVHFVKGRHIGASGGSRPLAYQPSLWSTTVDGHQPQRHATPPVTQSLRLDTVVGDGSFLVRSEGSWMQRLSPAGIAPLTNSMSVLRAASDGRTILVFGHDRIQRVDVRRSAEPQLLLSSAEDGAAWFPRPVVTLARSTAAPCCAGDARYVFALAGRLWTFDERGSAVPFVRESEQRAWATPRWSPDASRLAAFTCCDAEQRSMLLITDRSGARIASARGRFLVGQAVWSPDGAAVAVVEDPRTGPDPEFVVRMFSRDGTPAHAAPIAGRDIAWSRGGMFVLTNGTYSTQAGGRAGQAIEVHAGGATRTLTDAAALERHPLVAARVALPIALEIPLILSGLRASGDGTYLSVTVSRSSRTAGPPAFGSATVVLRATDGAVVSVLDGTASQISWSPAAPLLAYSASTGPDAPERSVVHSVDGSFVREHRGRFAGWAPDGDSWFIASAEGLFKHGRTDGAVRVSVLGVDVAAAPH